MHILVAEDDPLVLKAIEVKLTRDGYEVTACKNGREAWDMIEKERPDLVITDILMPFLSGLEIAGRIKNGVFHSIPVIILSSLTQENVVIESFKMGADDFISKPFSFSELSIRVNRLLTSNKYRSALLAV